MERKNVGRGDQAILKRVSVEEAKQLNIKGRPAPKQLQSAEGKEKKEGKQKTE